MGEAPQEKALPLAAHAVAQAIAGQRLWSVPVPLTALSPLELFGSIEGEQRMFVPAAGDLADIVIEAQSHPDQLGIVMLEGVDRVPFSPVIAPLLQQYRATRQHVRQDDGPHPPLRLFHPRSLAADDAYQQLSQLSWPANLLLVATFDHGIGNFPLAASYASWFMDIEDLRLKLSIAYEQEQKGDAADSYEVSPQNWYACEKACYRRAVEPLDSTGAEDLMRWQRMCYAAMEQVGIRGNNLMDMREKLRPLLQS